MGWLLYSAEEYNRKALCTEIWNLTGVQIAQCFWAIDDSTKKDPKNKTMPVKVLHIEIDHVHQTVTCSQINHLYLLKAAMFPLGFKMCLV